MTNFTFVDIFAGIGGFRIALEGLGGRCVFSCEKDRFARQTYQAWYGETPDGDITLVDPKEILDHDILSAGFPCQPFSISGVSKKQSLGREHGFKDPTQGTMFFYLLDIISVKRPRCFVLENVKNIRSHDKGNTWKVITESLKSLGYIIFDYIVDAKHWVPQHRERTIILGFDSTLYSNINYKLPEVPNTDHKLRDILLPNVDPKYTLSDKMWQCLLNHAGRSKRAGKGFGFGLANLNGISRTMLSRYYKDGSEILIPQEDKNPRRLTPRECARLMGFPDTLPIVVSDTQAYKQFGNAVVPAVVEHVMRPAVELLS